MDLSTFLNNVNGRKSQAKFGYGITTADNYLKQVSACAGDSVCSTYGAGAKLADAFNWEQVVKEASRKPVYSNEQMVVDQKTVTTNSSDFRHMVKKEGSEIPPKTIMVFQNIVTTPYQDRDGDILRTGGAQIDMKMPLLWQHMHNAPCGRMLEVVEHTKDVLRVTTAVIDSELGNDVANLIEFGGLRISHGFIPKEWEELKDGQGFDIKTFEIMEESVVSVPSNVEAVIDVFSRGKLADPLVKGWARHYYNERPTRNNFTFEISDGVFDVSNEKHVRKIEETDEEIVITFGKTEYHDKEDDKSGCGCKNEDVVEQDEAIEDKAAPDEVAVGDMVEWSEAGQDLMGEVLDIVPEVLEVEEFDIAIEGTEEDPALLVLLYSAAEEDVLTPSEFQTGVLASQVTVLEQVEEEEPQEDEDVEEQPDADAEGADDDEEKAEGVDLSVTQGMAEEAQRGLDWREEYERGGTQVGVTRANQIVSDGKLSADTWRRVKAYFDRHQKDREAEGFDHGEDGYPSAGRIAWALWGGDAGWTRSQNVVKQLNDAEDRGHSDVTEKGGRVVSGKNMERLLAAMELIQEAMADEKLPYKSEAMLEKAYNKLYEIKDEAGYERSVDADDAAIDTSKAAHCIIENIDSLDRDLIDSMMVIFDNEKRHRDQQVRVQWTDKLMSQFSE